MEEKKYYVYEHKNKANGKRYIGITKINPKARWGNNGIGYKTQNFWYAIEKYSWDGFEHNIIEENLTEKEAKEKEKYYIKTYNTIAPNGYNLTKGGDGSLGLFPSKETKKRQSISAKNRTDLNKEVICLETLEEFNSTRQCSEYIGVHSSNIINNCNGKHKTVKRLHFCYKEDYDNKNNEYFIENKTIKILLKENSEYKINEKPIICLETKETFKSSKYASQFLGFSGRKISISTIGHSSYSLSKYDNKKYHFMHIKEYNNASKSDIDYIMNYTVDVWNKRKVINLENNIIFDSIQEYQNYCNICTTSARKRLKRKKKAMYYDEYLKLKEKGELNNCVKQ